MKILVTGAAGFIGSNLVEKLLNKGHQVIGLDKDTNRYEHVNKNICMLNSLPKQNKIAMSIMTIKNFKMIWDDINSIKNYKYLLKDVDKIYHLAASADIKQSSIDTTLDLKNNVMGTHSILEFMRESDIKELIFSSSSSIYGEDPPIPTAEDVGNIKPISQYGASKLAGEAFISAYCSIYGMKSWMFRFANVVGKYQHRGVIYDFIQKLKKNTKDLEILGDGNQEKSFFGVGDCVRGLLEIPDACPLKNTTEAFNLGNLDTIKITKLASIVCEELNVTPKYKYTGGDRGWVGDAPSTILSINKALSAGWKPTMNCETAIRKTVGEIKNGNI